MILEEFFIKNNYLTVYILLIVLAIINEAINQFFSNFMVWVLISLPLTLILFVFTIVLFIISVITIFKNYKDTKVKSFFPLFLSIVLLFLLIFRPFSPLFQTIEFSLNLDEREEVADQILNGEIQPSNERRDLYQVPKHYNQSTISNGKEVLKMDDKLLFFKVRGILDNFSGYVYSPDGTEPTNEDVQADIIELRKMNAYWYYVACT